MYTLNSTIRTDGPCCIGGAVIRAGDRWIVQINRDNWEWSFCGQVLAADDTCARESDGLDCVWDGTDLRNYTVMGSNSGIEVILCEKCVPSTE